MTQDRELRHEDLDVPDMAARGARLKDPGSGQRRAAARRQQHPALLKNGPDTYDDWLTAIGRLERWIHLDNYIIANDEIGTRFAEALSAKAKEGVRVRVLHDWFGCMNVPRSFWRGMREAGAGQGCQPARFGAAARCYSARPPQAARHRRRVRLHGRGVHRRRLDGPLPRDGLALPGHRRQREGTGRRRHQPCLHQPVGRIGGRVCPRRSALSRGTSRRRERRPRVWSSRNREGCARSGCWSCSRPGCRSASG